MAAFYFLSLRLQHWLSVTSPVVDFMNYTHKMDIVILLSSLVTSNILSQHIDIHVEPVVWKMYHNTRTAPHIKSYWHASQPFYNKRQRKTRILFKYVKTFI